MKTGVNLFPPEVQVRLSRISDTSHDEALESAAVLGHVSKTRARAFSTGREVASRCLEALGSERTIVERGEHGEPIWPPGFVGSISHKAGWCACSVASADHVRSLGIDIERNEPMDSVHWDSIVVDQELTAIRYFDSVSMEEFVNILFSAKESVFKCQSPITSRQEFDLREISLTFDPLRNCFWSIIEGLEISVRLHMTEEFVLTGALLT